MSVPLLANQMVELRDNQMVEKMADLTAGNLVPWSADVMASRKVCELVVM